MSAHDNDKFNIRQLAEASSAYHHQMASSAYPEHGEWASFAYPNNGQNIDKSTTLLLYFWPMSDPLPSNLHQAAIQAALNSHWETAIKINKEILKVDPQSIDALNRLAKAYFETGNYTLAKKYYSATLKYDPYNPIAAKNLKILKATKADGKQLLPTTSGKISSSLFLQEPGKTKVVNLLKVAEPQKLSQVYPGMQVNMVVKNRGVTVATLSGGYLGVLPDDVSHHILRLTKGGNKYEIFIKAVKVNGLIVLIKEVFRSKRFHNQPSFLDSSQRGSNIDMLSATKIDDLADEDSDDSEELEEAEI
ncbi:MAG: tetratricopeptide repeat protein [Candidatus Daviesbacteria bacterium]|nr:MAG: tetratricopeptide repeat protein [Candidatus Daviesbacteria bacterium]